jgi:hypothetical protein
MKRKFERAAHILLAVFLFAAVGKLTFAGSDEAGIYPVTTNGNSGTGLNSSLAASSTEPISPDENKQIEQAKKLFIEKTALLRKQIFEKKLAMRDELRKNPPNGRNLGKLRREIYILKSMLNRQRYAFLKKMSSINPQIGGYHEQSIGENEGINIKIPPINMPSVQ